ncbi:hypothetical protein RFI_35111 [Reticulomyxa filosa]|uniref:Leucyl-tRNA synthetase n=1 Tax=Reticulomyxa filosa TaxID=46433 RepID=X6LNN4_RETFI|nr:hypothetical protein RFI_35111 [Reticulomyxa filosa]|eukprot:ETO02325.1 hypothetical protein RFI_35111 [Reticulomyxa filosa]
MNGILHLGHAFTLTNAEFAAGYQRLKVKNVLFPFGFHCTGMPIAACAQKIREEISHFGNPPQFPKEEQEDGKEKEETKEKNKGEEKKDEEKVKKKAKVNAKKSTRKHQWKIMYDFGLTDKEISSFGDPISWLKYFPKRGMEHLQRFGLKTDWRLSFITTDSILTIVHSLSGNSNTWKN